MPVATSAPSAAAVVAQRQVAPRQLDVTVRSSALGRTAQVRVLTPVGWTSSSRRRWPVLYLLHGCCDTYESGMRSTDVERLAQLRDVGVVMPEGGNVGFYSNWRDGPRWQDFHLRELPRILADRYGGGPRRAIAGLSMGGLGAMDYAAQRPGLFQAAASFSGVLHPLGAPGYWFGLFSSYTQSTRARYGAIRRPTATFGAATTRQRFCRRSPESRFSSPPVTGGRVPSSTGGADGTRRRPRWEPRRARRSPRAGTGKSRPSRPLRRRRPQLAVRAARSGTAPLPLLLGAIR